MKIFNVLFILFIIPFSTIFCQINLEDSTAQVIGYWEIGEQETYSVSYETYKVKDTDTTDRELITYDVGITIIDSTEKTYIIEWDYKNFDVETNNPLMEKIIKTSEDIKVQIQTDEFGSVLGVVNWEEVRDYMNISMDSVRVEFEKIPEVKKIFDQISNQYQSKEAIEGNAIKDAIQFYSFHGAQYTLNEELTGDIQLMNNYGGKPFDTKLTVKLEDINENDIVLRMSQIVDAKQLTDATYDFMKGMGTLGELLPPREEFPLFENNVWTASRIHPNSGWILFSIETKVIATDETIKIEERIIELK